jgi:hypothetical protein
VSERVTTLAAEIGDIVALSFAVIIISSTWDDASCSYGGGNSIRSFSGVEWFQFIAAENSGTSASKLCVIGS